MRWTPRRQICSVRYVLLNARVWHTETDRGKILEGVNFRTHRIQRRSQKLTDKAVCLSGFRPLGV